jgi:hypothetical protein
MEKEDNSYLKKLSANELKALEIAKDHLQTSFSLKKSIGFINYLENKES